MKQWQFNYWQMAVDRSAVRTLHRGTIHDIRWPVGFRFLFSNRRENAMKKILIVMCLPFCMCLLTGCGRSNQNTVIEGGPEITQEMMDQEEAELETVE